MAAPVQLPQFARPYFSPVAASDTKCRRCLRAEAVYCDECGVNMCACLPHTRGGTPCRDRQMSSFERFVTRLLTLDQEDPDTDGDVRAPDAPPTLFGACIGGMQLRYKYTHAKSFRAIADETEQIMAMRRNGVGLDDHPAFLEQLAKALPTPAMDMPDVAEHLFLALALRCDDSVEMAVQLHMIMRTLLAMRRGILTGEVPAQSMKLEIMVNPFMPNEQRSSPYIHNMAIGADPSIILKRILARPSVNVLMLVDLVCASETGGDAATSVLSSLLLVRLVRLPGQGNDTAMMRVLQAHGGFYSIGQSLAGTLPRSCDVRGYRLPDTASRAVRRYCGDIDILAWARALDQLGAAAATDDARRAAYAEVTGILPDATTAIGRMGVLMVAADLTH